MSENLLVCFHIYWYRGLIYFKLQSVLDYMIIGHKIIMFNVFSLSHEQLIRSFIG